MLHAYAVAVAIIWTAIGTTNGGGVTCIGDGIITTVSCHSDNNAAASNGGVFNLKNSSIVVEECSFLGNTAQGTGSSS